MNNVNKERKALQVPPDLTIVAVGGCGKRLTAEICEQKWFLKHYMVEGRRLKIYTIDADENERDQDEFRRKEITKSIEEMGGRRSVETSVYYLPHLANISHVSDLASKEIADKIKDRKAEPAINVWWLNDSEYGISFKDLKRIDPYIIDDFGGGVHRRRAISKAIFYKVLSVGESSGFPTFSGRGQIAIIVGLGGGTGSGMSIDLARYIKSLRGKETEIWLFGVLPTTEEGEKEQLNAAIALTELEYLNMEEGLFKYVVLTSLGPTGFKKGEEAKKEVQEFDSVFPYIFVNSFYLKTGDIDVSDVRKPYSSFIFADAHVIEYPIKELRELKNDFESVISEMEEITKNRKELNSAIRESLDKAGQRKEEIPTTEDFDFIKKEIDNIAKTWENETGELLNYQTVKAVKYFVENNIPSELFPDRTKKYDELINYISKLKGFIQVVNEEELKDESDRKQCRLIPESLDVIEDTAKLLKRCSGIHDESARLVLKETSRGKENITPLLGDLQTRIKSFKDDIHDLEEKIEKRNKELKETELLKSLTEDFVGKKLDEIAHDVDSFVSLSKKIPDIKEIERGLKIKIDEIVNKFKSEEVKGEDEITWLQSSGIAELQGEIDSASREFGEDLEGLNSLVKAIAIYYHYNHKLKKLDSRGFMQKIIDAIKGNTERKRRKYEALRRDKEDYIKGSARSWGIAIHTPFELDIADNFLTSEFIERIEDRKKRMINTVISDFDTKNEDIKKLESIFGQGGEDTIRLGLKEWLNNLSLFKEGYYQKKEELERDIESLSGIKLEKGQDLMVMENIDELAAETFSYRRNLNRHYDLFYDVFGKISVKSAASSRTTKGLYMTKFGEINPKVLSLISDGSDMKDLESDENGKKELDKLINEIKSVSPRLMDNYILGIHNLIIPTGDGETEKWNFGRAGLVISSTSPYISGELSQSQNSKAIGQEINDILALSDLNHAKLVTHNYSKPWDVALTFFAAASFLDNISPLTAGGGYWGIYEKNKDDILHHVLSLQEGRYIVRERLLELNKAGEIANRERNGDKINTEILEFYEEKDIKDAVKE